MTKYELTLHSAPVQTVEADNYRQEDGRVIFRDSAGRVVIDIAESEALVIKSLGSAS